MRIRHRRWQIIIPDQLAPVRWDEPVGERLGDHALMTLVSAQHMVIAAQRPEIRQAVRAGLAADDVVDVAIL